MQNCLIADAAIGPMHDDGLLRRIPSLNPEATAFGLDGEVADRSIRVQEPSLSVPPGEAEEHAAQKRVECALAGFIWTPDDRNAIRQIGNDVVLETSESLNVPPTDFHAADSLSRRSSAIDSASISASLKQASLSSR